MSQILELPKEAPLVSVIIPTFNCAPFIAASLDSVFQQDYPNLEIIVVDDGSTDGTLDVLAKYSDRVQLFRQSNLGPAAARNTALKYARGDYIAFQDGDDLWLPGKLLAQMAYLCANPEVKIVYARHFHWSASEDGTYPAVSDVIAHAEASTSEGVSGWIYCDLLLESHVHIITAVVAREVFSSHGQFDGCFGKGSDYDFWLRVSYDYRIERLLIDAALYRHNSDGITARPSPVCAQYEIVQRMIDKHGIQDAHGRSADRKRLAAILANICFVHAYACYWWGDLATAFRYFRKSLEKGGWSVKCVLYLVLSGAGIRLKPRK